MSQRPDLDIGDYINALGTGGAEALGYNRQVRPNAYGRNASPPPPPREVREEVDAERPYLVGWSSPEASTCTELERIEPVIWDVNRYYRDLGFRWPYTGIGRKELMRAYQALGGSVDVRLTYCFNQLLDKDVRWEYDRTPLGDVYFDDYIADDLRRRAVQEATRRYVEKGVEPDAKEVFKEWGFEDSDEPEKPVKERRREAEVKDRAKRLSKAQRAVTAFWGWSYYVWRARPTMNSHRLARWQELLLKEYKEKNVRARFCVGIVGHQPHPWVVGEVGRRTVFFLNEDASLEPTSTMAERAVAFVLSEEANHSHQ